jgi:orotidine-5'-phosphate decarboxylase
MKQGCRLTAKERLILALDVASLEEAASVMEQLKEEVGLFKIGLELFTSCGTALFDLAAQHGVKIFFDTKFHDIPNTVSQAARAATRHRVDMFNLHAQGGKAMMEASAQAVAETAREMQVAKPALIAVTILTSTRAECLSDELKVSLPLAEMVPYLARLAKESGLDGVVASAAEARAIREACGPDFLIVTPGIRPRWAEANDQVRIVTPTDAIVSGSDYLVVGRPIMKAPDKLKACRQIVEEIQAGIS